MPKRSGKDLVDSARRQVPHARQKHYDVDAVETFGERRPCPYAAIGVDPRRSELGVLGDDTKPVEAPGHELDLDPARQSLGNHLAETGDVDAAADDHDLGVRHDQITAVVFVSIWSRTRRAAPTAPAV